MIRPILVSALFIALTLTRVVGQLPHEPMRATLMTYKIGDKPSASSLLTLPNQWNWMNPNLQDGQNGGGKCAACTLVVGLLEQVLQLQNYSIDRVIDKLCKKAKSPWDRVCTDVVNAIVPALIKIAEEGASADVICHAVKLCETETAYCHLFPKGFDDSSIERKVRILQQKFPEQLEDIRAFNICTIIPEVCKVADHLPAFDSDGDTFSTFKELRGTYWRGKDCDDLDVSIHPGVDSTDAVVDQNCNGIFGTDVATGVAYETSLCNNTDATGIAILGDSATAHFRIPPGWVTASNVSWADYGGLLRDATDELDWPMLSWSTGHLNASEFHPDIHGPMKSVYSQMRERNLCNNNDYQNLGVNGAKSTNLLDFAHLVGRVKGSGGGKQKPLMLFMAMIGNDVCNHYHGFHTMTPADVYRAAVEEAVLYADTILEKGSKIVLVGLADGRVLYEYMHNRIHPIGKTNNDVTYKDLYNFLNCLDISPCWGWMNDNATVRNLTTDHANLLSDQLYVVQNATKKMLNNTEVFVITDWIQAIKEAPFPKWELIEPVDGFHPSQLGNFLLGEYFFNQTLKLGIAGQENPHNAEIKKMFNL